MEGQREKLKRELGLGYLTLFGVALILGAGIYVLIGKTAGYVGDAVWTSVLFGSIVALLTGFSFAELAGMYPFASSSYTYVKKAFPKRDSLAFLTGWFIFFDAIAGAATAALGFAGYFTKAFGISEAYIPIIAIITIIILTIINWIGIKESAIAALALLILEVFGLIFITFLGFLFTQRQPNYAQVTPPAGIDVISAVLIGAAVFYFAYTGFELQPTLAEEAKNPRENVPKAIVLALIICSILYLLVAFAVVRLIPPAELAKSPAPLAAAAEAVSHEAYIIMLIAALFSTGNTVLGFLVSGSRLAYGLAEEGILYRKLALVDRKRRTPYVAVFMSGIIGILIIVFCDAIPRALGIKVRVTTFQLIGLTVTASPKEYELIEIVGKGASLACIITFVIINIAVIALRYREQEAERTFKVPLSIGKFPVLSAIAAILCVYFIITAFLDWIVWLVAIIVLIIGFTLYFLRPKA